MKKEVKETDNQNVELDEKTKSMLMLFAFVILACIIIFAGRGKSYTPVFEQNKTNGNKQTEQKEEKKSTDVLDYLKLLENDNYETIFTVEPDNEKEYFYLRMEKDGNKSLFYKEYKDKEYIYLKKGSVYYITGSSTWKKTNNPMSYEGYDTLLFNPSNLYKLISYNEGYEIDKTEEEKTLYKIDINNLINIYNEEAEIGKTISKIDEKTVYVYVTTYENTDSHRVIEIDLKDYYKLIYNKEYEHIYYTFEYYGINKSDLSNIESFEFVK